MPLHGTKDGAERSAPSTRGTASTNRVPCLVLLSERFGDKVFPLRDAAITIGRSLEAGVHIDDPQVSKRHAEIIQRPEGFWLRDLGSRNGSKVNGEVVTERLLRPGDRIELGDAVTLFFTDKQIHAETTRRGRPEGLTGVTPPPGPLVPDAPLPRTPGAGETITRAPDGAASSDENATRRRSGRLTPGASGLLGSSGQIRLTPPPSGEGASTGESTERGDAPKGPAPAGTVGLRPTWGGGSASGPIKAPRRISLSPGDIQDAIQERRPARAAYRLEEQHLTLLYQLADTLGGATNESDLLERALDLALALVPADRGYVYLAPVTGSGGGPPRLAASRGRREGTRIEGLDLPVSHTIVEQVLKEHTALSTSDAGQDGRFDGAESVARHRIRAVAAAPMVAKGRTLGVIYLDQDAPDYLFNKAELSLLTAIGFHGGAALEMLRGVAALEARVLERTREVERLSRERAELLAMAAHDLKTPLAGLMGYLECLALRSRAEGLADWVGDEIEGSREAARVMMDLLTDLLDSERAEAGRIEVRKEAIDLAEFARGAASLYERWAKGADRRVELTVAERLPPAAADRRRLTQILNNLVHNALKYTPRKGCVRVEVSAIGGTHVQFSVEDEGQGFKPHDSDKILLSFERGTSVEPARGEGHGLGLAIVKKLVGALGGMLAVDGRPGQGARFSFVLPVQA